jgi:hypothetical protein
MMLDRLVRAVVLLLFSLQSVPIAAAEMGPFGLSPGTQCRMAIGAAERATNIPAHLLAAIGRIESGRRDPQSGGWNPWPWTINAEGEGHFYESKAEAIAAVRAFQQRGVQSIDVGCMQVNLMHHPNAFASLEQAFDPQGNTAYAARFLNTLFLQTQSWPKAAGLYHSATPDLMEDYQRKVLAAWPEESRPDPTLSGAQAASAWTLTRGGGYAAGRITVMIPTNRLEPPRILPAFANSGTPIPGRGLDAYRAAPIPLTGRPLLRPPNRGS